MPVPLPGWKTPPPERVLCSMCSESMPNVVGIMVCKRCQGVVERLTDGLVTRAARLHKAEGVVESDGSIQVGDGR